MTFTRFLSSIVKINLHPWTGLNYAQAKRGYPSYILVFTPTILQLLV